MTFRVRREDVIPEVRPPYSPRARICVLVSAASSLATAKASARNWRSRTI